MRGLHLCSDEERSKFMERVGSDNHAHSLTHTLLPFLFTVREILKVNNTMTRYTIRFELLDIPGLGVLLPYYTTSLHHPRPHDVVCCLIFLV